jgi:hypothetical protein
MTEFDYSQMLGGAGGVRPSAEFLDGLWEDMEAELDRVHEDARDDGRRRHSVAPAVAGEPMQPQTGFRWVRPLLLVAAVLLIVGIVAVGRGFDDDTDDIIVTETPTPSLTPTPPSTPPPSPTATPPTPTPASVLRPEPRHAVNQRVGEPPVLDPLAAGVTYELGQVTGARLQVPAEPALPHGWAYTPRFDDGVNINEGGFVREYFLPGAGDVDDYPEVLDRFREPTGVVPRELPGYPLVEVVKFPPLGPTVEDVLAAFTANTALELLTGPEAGTLGGLDSLTFEARTVGRAIIASGESTTGGSPVSYFFPEGLRLAVHIVDTADGPVVVSVSTDAAGFDQWLPVAERLLDGMTFAPA